MRTKFLLKFEELAYGNNFSMDKLLKVIALISFYTTVLYFVYNQKYYSIIGLNFQDFSKTSDYIPSFFSEVYVTLIIISLILLFQFFAANSDLKYQEELLQKGEHKKFKSASYRYIFATLLSCLPAAVILINLFKNLYDNNWVVLKTELPEIALLTVLTFLLFSFKKKILNCKNFTVLFLSISSLVFSITLGYVNGKRINNNIFNKYHYYEFKYDSQVVKTNKLNNVVIAQTKGFLFIKNIKSGSIEVYNRSKISEFKILKNIL